MSKETCPVTNYDCVLTYDEYSELCDQCLLSREEQKEIERAMHWDSWLEQKKAKWGAENAT